MSGDGKDDGPATVDRTALPSGSAAGTVEPAASDHPTTEALYGPPTPADDAILPATYREGDLRDAVGAKPGPPSRDDDAEYPRRPRSRRTIVVTAGSILVGLSVAALVFLGRANAERYLIVCSSEHVAVEQGRAFPPWGSHTLSGPEWKAVTLPPNAECTPHETDDRDELERWYLEILVDRASTTLAARDVLASIPAQPSPGQSDPLDVATAELEQALLLARSPDRRDQRKEIERLQGDVEYWRASARLRDASNTLIDAAKQFDDAAARRPRHVSDAAAWATLLRRLADELHSGPAGSFATAPSAPEPHLPAPLGAARPVEPPAAGSADTVPVDAGVSAGGVLL